MAPMEPPLGRRLWLGHRAVHDALDERMAEHGASIWHWILLKHAAESEGSSQRELAEHMHIEPPTLVRHLDKLAHEGLVERRRDENDRRVARVLPHAPRGASASPSWGGCRKKSTASSARC